MARKKKESVQPAPQKVQPSAGAGRTVVVALCRAQGLDFPMPDGRIVSIAGSNAGLRGQITGILPVGEFGYTEIAEQDWLYIKKTWAEWRLFKNGLIFAQTKVEDARAEAKEKAELRHGFEPIDPERQAKTEPMKAGE